MQNQIEKINKQFEKRKNSKKIKKDENFEINKQKYMDLKKQNEKQLKEIQKYNSIINNLVTANKNMSDIYNNKILSLKEVYSEMNKKNNTIKKEKRYNIEEDEEENYDDDLDEEKISDYNYNENEDYIYEHDNITINDSI